MAPAGQLTIEVEDPRTQDIAALLLVHTSVARSETPPQDAHALDGADLVDPSVTFFAVRRAGRLLAIGAIRELTPEHAELKSMHTAAVARRQGVGEALLAHLLLVARDRGYRRVSIETGAHPMFAPARALYAKAGFSAGPPFGEYRASPHSVYMALDLRGPLRSSGASGSATP
jgi:putative acetyltransferase